MLLRRILPIKFYENRFSISSAIVCYTRKKEQSDLNRRLKSCVSALAQERVSERKFAHGLK